MPSVLLVGLGGFLGASSRYLLTELAARVLGTGFPYGTLLANVSGSLLLGLLVGTTHERGGFAVLHPLLGIGFLGGFTTFSTFSVDTILLAGRGAPGLALANAAANLGLALAAAALGLALARSV
jgi:CrcB protein